jgi:hypothetical protein
MLIMKHNRASIRMMTAFADWPGFVAWSPPDDGSMELPSCFKVRPSVKNRLLMLVHCCRSSSRLLPAEEVVVGWDDGLGIAATGVETRFLPSPVGVGTSKPSDDSTRLMALDFKSFLGVEKVDRG